MITNLKELEEYNCMIRDYTISGVFSDKEGARLIREKYEEFKTMSSTTNKIKVMQAYDRGERIKCTKRSDKSNFIFYYKDNIDEKMPVWDWFKCYYEVMSPAVKFKGFMNVGREELYSGSTVYITQEAAEDNSYTGDNRIAVPVLVTEITNGC